MKRYIKQKDYHSCGPIAIINILKWSGVKATYSQLKRFQLKCKCKKPFGTKSYIFSQVLNQQKSIVVSRKLNWPSANAIDSWLDKGNAVVVRYDYFYKEWRGHFAIITHRFAGCYVLHNIDGPKEDVTTFWDKAQAKRYLYSRSKSGKKRMTEAWLIRKK